MSFKYPALAAVLLAGTSAPAFAQAGANQPSETPQSPAEDAAQQAATDATLEPTSGNAIVVTAQRREQTLQDVSASVVAVGADRLASSQVNSLQDLQTIVPSVNFGNDFNQAKIFIRGVGANTSTTGNATGVALHVDGAVVARAEAQLTSLFDLERVEVLRGPQGTLYGRNATGGSINLITAKPTDYLSGYGRLTYGNYNAIVAEGAISGPITENVLFRIAGKTEDRDGFGENPVTGSEVDDLKRRMIRGMLQFNFSDTTDLLLSGEYFRQDDHSGAVHYLRASFPDVPRLAPLGVGGYATDPRDLASEVDVGTITDSYSFTGTFRTELTDTLTLTNIANYRSFETSLFQDLDLSAVIESLETNGQPTTVQERRIDSEQYSNELQFNYSIDNLDLVVGGFYFHERQRPIDNVGLSRRNGMASNIPILEAAGIDLAEAYELCGYSPDGVSGGSTIIAPKRAGHADTRARPVHAQAGWPLQRREDRFPQPVDHHRRRRARAGDPPHQRKHLRGAQLQRLHAGSRPPVGAEPRSHALLHLFRGLQGGLRRERRRQPDDRRSGEAAEPRGRREGDRGERGLGQPGGLHLRSAGRAAEQDHRRRPDGLYDDLRERRGDDRQGP
jgi:iron complex outermembrane receptor protein